MMIEEFEKRTGIFPDMETYRVIEAYYCEFDGDKDAFCKAFKANKKLVENIVQATARDCLAVAMTRVSTLGYKIVMHVHDEMIVDVPNTDTEAPSRINAIMAQPIDWAEGLPLKGDTYETPFYKKD